MVTPTWSTRGIGTSSWLTRDRRYHQHATPIQVPPYKTSELRTFKPAATVNPATASFDISAPKTTRSGRHVHLPVRFTSWASFSARGWCGSLPWEPPTGYPFRYRSNNSINIIIMVTCGRFPWKAPTTPYIKLQVSLLLILTEYTDSSVSKCDYQQRKNLDVIWRYG
jgi:hypothetical protein